METLNLIQGSAEWLATRLNYFTASEAAVMMGDSPHMSRDDLLTYKKTTVQAEVDHWTQKIYDKGHALEKQVLPIVERILGKDLYPVTGAAEIDGLPLLASFDGLDMMEEAGFEHKQWNAAKAAQMRESSEVLPEYVWQLEHQLLVSGAQFILFVMSDGTESNWFELRYESLPERRAQLIAGWKQFAEDLETHVPAEYLPAPQAKAIKELPALHISLVGQVRNSNLIEYKQTAMAFVESINTNLETDQDFADAEKTIKFCDAAEKELEVVKKSALGQTADIAELFRNVDELRDAMKAKRLELDKLVKARKEAIRVQVVHDRNTALNAHIAALNCDLSRGIRLPVIHADFAGAIKGKKTIKSLHESANEELARAKIEASQIAERYRLNLSILEDFAAEYRFLFNDLQAVISKPADDFELLVVSRVDQHKAKEAEKMEAEKARIEAETEVRLKREAEEKAELEAAEKAKAEAAKAVEQPAYEKQSEPFCGGTLTRNVQVTRAATPDQATALEFAAEAAPERLSGVPDSHEGDIMNWLYSQEKIYGEQGHRIARALMSGRVPHMKYLAEEEAKAA
jgi:predicted phage-related endonuclease